MGFCCFIYWLWMDVNGVDASLCLSNYPTRERSSQSERLQNRDFVLTFAPHTNHPFLWHDPEHLVPRKSANENEIMEKLSFFEESADPGATVPLHGPERAFGAFSVKSEKSREEFEKLFEQKCQDLHLYAAFIHEHVINQNVDRKQNDQTILTDREKEVLVWAARGKTKWEISVILGISKDTVKTTQSRACKKLDASNVMHAISAAIINGHIDP